MTHARGMDGDASLPDDDKDAIDLWRMLFDEHRRIVESREDRPPPGGPSAAEETDRLLRRILEAGRDGPPERRDSVRLAEVYRAIHDQHPTRALCLSGGGIRSATFNLGLLQGLAKAGYLDTFDYLSTVSGGGYIGGWLTAWAQREIGGISAVQDRLAAGTRPAAATDPADAAQARLRLEPAEVSYLREYSNFLTPRLGGLSRDTWSLLATYPRNLLLNWLVLLPLLACVIATVWLFVATAANLPAYAADAPANTTSDLLAAGLCVYLVGICLAMPFAPFWYRRKDGHEATPVGWVRGLRRWRPVILVVVPTYLGSLLTAAVLPACGFGAGLDGVWRFGRVLLLYFVPAMTVLTFACLLWRRYSRRHSFTQAVGPLTLIRTFGVYFIAMTAMFGVLMLAKWAVPGVHDPQTEALFALWLIPPVRLLMAYAFFTMIVGLTSELYSPDMEESREWWATLMGQLLLFAVLHAAVFGLVCVVPPLIGAMKWPSFVTLSSGTAVSTVFTLVAGRSQKTGLDATLSPRRDFLMRRLPAVAAVVAMLAILALASYAMADALGGGPWPGLMTRIRTPKAVSYAGLIAGAYWQGAGPVTWTAAIAAGGGALALLFSWPINVNRFSLHGTYRMRLVRAYLGASRGARRNPDLFTGFDGKDNLPLHTLRRPRYITRGDLTDPPALAGVIVDQTNSFSDYVRTSTTLSKSWKPLEDLAAGRLPFGGEPHRQAVGRMIAALNELLDDEQLLNHAFQDGKATGEAVLRRSPGVIPGDVRMAYRQIPVDGASHTCNRLILEHCLKRPDGPPLIRPRLLRPLHVINAALNLVGGKKLAWQQRKAASFTFTPLHCGFDGGYRPSVSYANGMTLGGAITVSGAAASPNMGYHSSSAVTALLTLFNVRLGCWLGNTTTASQTHNRFLRRTLGRAHLPIPAPSFRLQAPRFSMRPLLDEALGRTDERNGYVYLSDGGHFDNLGLYEMVRRRCRVIVVSDASCDPHQKLVDLGSAVRKIRIDLGVNIKIRRVNFDGKPDAQHPARYCTVGRILYSEVDGDGEASAHMDGLLIYFKPVLLGREPVDVFHYHRESGAFPHESTADQWFTESQFESYRRLGETAAEQVMGVLKGGDGGLREEFEKSRTDVEALRDMVDWTIGCKKPAGRWPTIRGGRTEPLHSSAHRRGP